MGRPRKTNLRPIEEDIIDDSCEIEPEELVSQEEKDADNLRKIRVENDISFFESHENDPDFSDDRCDDISNYEKKISELNAQISILNENITDLNKEIETLRNENSVLQSKNTVLNSEIENLSKKIKTLNESQIDVNEISKIRDENDNLLLKNSELELELSKMRVQLKNNVTIGKPSNTQVYSKEQYTSLPGNVVNRKNGYQDWN